MSDSTLRQNVLDELEFEPSIDANDIGVAVEGGVVTLSGHVSSYSQKAAVECAVQRVRGVKGIAENIEVRLADGRGTSDDEIARRAISMMKWSTFVPDDRVQVTVEGGHITLAGTLDWNYQREGAENVLAGIAGVTGVTNLIALRKRVLEQDVKQRIESALGRNANIKPDDVRVKVEGNGVVLEGSVGTWSERRLVEAAAWSVPGVTAVDNDLWVGR